MTWPNLCLCYTTERIVNTATVPVARRLVGCVFVPCTRMCSLPKADRVPECGRLHNGVPLSMPSAF